MPPTIIPVGSRYSLSVNDVYTRQFLPAREQHCMACQIRAVIMEVEMKLSNDLHSVFECALFVQLLTALTSRRPSAFILQTVV